MAYNRMAGIVVIGLSISKAIQGLIRWLMLPTHSRWVIGICMVVTTLGNRVPNLRLVELSQALHWGFYDKIRDRRCNCGQPG